MNASRLINLFPRYVTNLDKKTTNAELKLIAKRNLVVESTTNFFSREQELSLSAIRPFFIIPPEEWIFPANGDVIEAKRRTDSWLEARGSLVGAERSIEEFVRQWALRELMETFEYPVEWIGERIVIEEPVRMGSTYKQADISIRNGDRRTFLFIETKAFDVSDDDFLDAERQLESYLAATHTATIGMVTDGKRTRVIRKKIDPNDFEYISALPGYSFTGSFARTRLVREIPNGALASDRSTGLKVITEVYERLLFECHNAARDIDGLHADEALDEICKVLYTKIYDERLTTKGPEGTPFRFQAYGASNSSEVASIVRTIYDDARTDDLEIYSKRIPGYERSRGVFKQQIRLSDTALFRIVELLQDYSFIDSKADIKGRAFQKILAPAIRAGMGQYFTPDPIVDLAVKLIEPTANDLILDPFCGSGHFLTSALNFVLEHQSSTMTEHDIHEFKFFHLHGIEKSDRMVRIAMTDMMLHDDGHTNVRNQDALLSFDNYPDITALREDGSADASVFNVVLTNPPFGSIMRQETMAMLGRFELGQNRKSVPLEFLGLERAVQFLAPEGRMAIVLPEHIMKGKTTAFVRNWLSSQVDLKAVFFFPEEAFSPFGALVKTCLALLEKPTSPRTSAPANHRVFLCEIENLGYDATGRLKSGSEIDGAVLAYRAFREAAHENTN